MRRYFLLVLFSLFSLRAKAEFDQNYETYFSGQTNSYDSTVLNPGNQVFKSPSDLAEADFRLNWQYSLMKSHKIVLRPRYLLTASTIRLTNPNDEIKSTRGKIELTDFFIEDQWTDSFKTVLGLQVYQWGPAELINPSNPLFHFNSRQRGAFYKEKGQILVRGNIDWNKHWGQVFIFEPVSNNDPEWIGKSEFVPKGLVKTEYRFENSAEYLGFVIGREEVKKTFIGEYLTFLLYEGFSAYFDNRHTQGQVAYQPVSNIYGGYSLARNDASAFWQTLSISGLRYEASNFDIRFEYVFNEAGMNKEKFSQYLLTIQQITPDLANNLIYFTKPGLELLGQNYAYLSLRIPNLGKKENMNLAFRLIGSLQDSSAVLQSDFDKNINDHLTAYLESFSPFGSKETELNLLGQNFYMMGLKWSL